ncbi:hypothetical protein ANN_02986 [Periplaneta americana]|uniref:Uncharacterized protein n=1 Tax=Periplaneta americana TaxID=6978 RepID=A0ABQ8TZH0_PERAM|nr:hypothetical protein ANN_02986 [Periplaneta americana]
MMTWVVMATSMLTYIQLLARWCQLGNAAKCLLPEELGLLKYTRSYVTPTVFCEERVVDIQGQPPPFVASRRPGNAMECYEKIVPDDCEKDGTYTPYTLYRSTYNEV